jgi:hypothetical protein
MEIVTGAETCIRVGTCTAEPAGSSWLLVSDTGRDRAPRQGRDRDRSAAQGSRGRRGSRGACPSSSDLQ